MNCKGEGIRWSSEMREDKNIMKVVKEELERRKNKWNRLIDW